MMPEVHREVLPKKQLHLWKRLQPHASALHHLGFYLAGGTALSLQVGHRQSLDFDFFSRQPNIAEPVSNWLQNFPDSLLRETDAHTLHAEIAGVRVSFIGNYRYPLVEKCLTLEKMPTAGILDIGLMKLLAITHRATLRDYLDLAAILRDQIPLDRLLKACAKKYGSRFNVMICLKALVSFQDIEQEKPILLDKKLDTSWQRILIRAVQEVAR